MTKDKRIISSRFEIKVNDSHQNREDNKIMQSTMDNIKMHLPYEQNHKKNK